MAKRLLATGGVLALVAVAAWLVGGGASPEALAASRDVERAVTVIESDIAWNLKLMEFDRIRAEGSSTAIAALVKLTASEDARVRTLACTTLGRMKSEASKAELKKLAVNAGKGAHLRIAATCALARNGTASDRSWIVSNLSDDSVLKGQVALLEQASFWR